MFGAICLICTWVIGNGCEVGASVKALYPPSYSYEPAQVVSVPPDPNGSFGVGYLDDPAYCQDSGAGIYDRSEITASGVRCRLPGTQIIDSYGRRCAGEDRSDGQSDDSLGGDGLRDGAESTSVLPYILGALGGTTGLIFCCSCIIKARRLSSEDGEEALGRRQRVTRKFTRVASSFFETGAGGKLGFGRSMTKKLTKQISFGWNFTKDHIPRASIRSKSKRTAPEFTPDEEDPEPRKKKRKS